jgi:hypothetical protein
MNLVKGRCFSLLKVPFLYHLVLEKNSAASRISSDFFFKFQTGDGNGIFLWLGNWHPDCILVNKYGCRIVLEAGSRLDDRLSSVISGRECHWLPAKLENMVKVQCLLSLVRLGEKAAPLRLPAKNKFSLVKILGRPFERRNRGWNGAGLFGILFLSLSMLSFYGLHLKID